MEPFDEFIKYPRGTLGYFPDIFDPKDVKTYFPQIYTNDMVKIQGRYQFDTNRKLVYLIDSFCLGRVFYLLKNVYDSVKPPSCFSGISKKVEK